MPINYGLVDAGEPSKIADLAGARDDFGAPWRIANAVGTVTCVLALACLGRAMVLHGRNLGPARRLRPPSYAVVSPQAGAVAARCPMVEGWAYSAGVIRDRNRSAARSTGADGGGRHLDDRRGGGGHPALVGLVTLPFLERSSPDDA